MDKIRSGFESSVAALPASLSDPLAGWAAAGLAIMTTDTVPKVLHRSFSIDHKQFTFSGICKGAGMIHPNMATMLGVIATDLSIAPDALQTALKFAADRSFNSISIDGDTSTNDSLVVLANGQAPQWKQPTPAAGAKQTYGQLKGGGGEWRISLCVVSHSALLCFSVFGCVVVLSGISSVNDPAYPEFQRILTAYCIELAHLIVRDGEGATKFATVRVTGGRSYAESKIIANSVATSMLVKSALFGQDANWGRILCAVGYAGVPIDADKVNLFIRPANEAAEPAAQALPSGAKADTATASPSAAAPLTSLHIVRGGQPFDCNEAHATALFKQRDIILHIDLGLGKEEASVYTCDLSLDYVKINADYRS